VLFGSRDTASVSDHGSSRDAAIRLAELTGIEAHDVMVVLAMSAPQNRDGSGRFPKGVSGNAGGRPHPTSDGDTDRVPDELPPSAFSCKVCAVDVGNTGEPSLAWSQ
jgi:hypothetical protein